MQRRSLCKLIATTVSAMALSTAALHAMAADETIKIGVTAGPHAQIMEQVKKVAAHEGLNLKIIEFSDYVQPNAALAAGDIDANSYQHQPYLDAQVRDRGYKLVSVAQTINFPMGIYSRKIKSLSELKSGARVALPNDPTNGGRAYLLLQKAGLIKLRAGAGLSATSIDVAENPKKLKFVELDAAQIPHSLDDVDIAAINTNFALEAGLSPARDAIELDPPTGPYANVLVVRAQDKDKPWVAKLVKAYRSPEVKQFVTTTFKGSVITAW
ncbi:MetQ/NlpA family ABC transporter substrate-binding protein [Robbsia andropogonis]|uniref:MetQ/NlpA family ABC transporter substrate-binding protein n=1 Tax=Robbsia andropogonis TaxID=28092 RepID=UPI000465A421|nr:MetQ/NlpA family ABC transporter substrate-binding protein [Robbsia andropogonis]MCP1120043.1 MetQ/NlpA family ABC transporter substrate-binding protein [Robbsia andropogonis]MCP1129898.1 MetQ/NlpA family ABC transporter substrate-binding protein [Robbsia andropogonis]